MNLPAASVGFARRMQKPVEAISPSSSSGTTATAFRFGRTVETRTSPARTAFLARLGASAPSSSGTVVIRFASLSMAEMSIYRKGFSGDAVGSRCSNTVDHLQIGLYYGYIGLV